MKERPTSSDAPAFMDIAISTPVSGAIRVQSAVLFADPDQALCRRFLGRAFRAEELTGAKLNGAEHPAADLYYDPRRHTAREVLAKVAAILTADEPLPADYSLRGDGHPGTELAVVAPPITARDRHGVVHYHRYGARLTGWQVVHDKVGALKLKNPVLYRKNAYCQAIERELMSVLGVDRYQTHALNCTVRIDYDPRRLTRNQVIEILDEALAGAEHQEELDKLDLDLAICTGSLALAAATTFAAPALLPVSAALFAYTTIPSFQGAYEVVFKERRLGVDFLDAVVVLGCLGTLQVLPGAVLAWCLSFGRMLVKKTEDNSKKMLLSAFGKQPRFVWLYKDGVEVEVSLDKIQQGDLVVVHTGDAVPVDGHIVEGMAMIDQHALTGESTPAEKGVGDRVFASTILVAGKIFVSVEKAGSETASAKISQILNDTAGYKLTSQNKGERLADTAVVPTLAVGALAFATMGPFGGVAVLNSDLGTGIRMAAPLAMLSTLALCAQKGILVKDGRALEGRAPMVKTSRMIPPTPVAAP